MSKPVILFDVMDTLVRDPFHRELPRAFGFDGPVSFLRHKRDGLWPRFERGEIGEERFVRECLVDGPAPTVSEVHDALREGYRWMDDMKVLLDRLNGAGVEMHAFSNYPSWYRLIEDELELSRFLNWSFVSVETGYRKPSQEAFNHVLESLDTCPSDCVFVDNSERNVRVARLLGFRTHRFRGASRLKKYFQSIVPDVRR